MRPSVSLVSLVCSCRWTLAPKARKAEPCHKPLLCQRQGFGVECKYIYPQVMKANFFFVSLHE